MPKNLEQLAALISRRDGISMNEARNLIDETQEEINYVINNTLSYDEVVDVIKFNLNLEPDYLDLFLF